MMLYKHPMATREIKQELVQNVNCKHLEQNSVSKFKQSVFVLHKNYLNKLKIHDARNFLSRSLLQSFFFMSIYLFSRPTGKRLKFPPTVKRLPGTASGDIVQLLCFF